MAKAAAVTAAAARVAAVMASEGGGKLFKTESEFRASPGSAKTAVGKQEPVAFEGAKATSTRPELGLMKKGLRGEFRGCLQRLR